MASTHADSGGVCVAAARRAGAVVDTERKTAAGGNKAHQGTDHQRIAKLDRENEVAPPPKIAPSVGKVRVEFVLPAVCADG
jgi:hypothetical protein